LWGADGPLSGSTGTFLPPGFSASAAYLAAVFGFVGAKTGVCHLAYVCLVHEINVYWRLEN